MTKEIHAINTRALDFVVELIEYIFEYPDDDYMTMECLCRKLVKHGLMDKADGRYEPTDEPTISKMEQVEDEFKQFDREDLILLIECQKERIAELLANDEPQTEAWQEPFEADCSWK